MSLSRASGFTAGIISSTTLSGTYTTTFTLNVKPATTNDSLLITMFFQGQSTPTVSDSTGNWAAGPIYVDSGDNCTFASFYKRATASDISGLTYTITTPSIQTAIKYEVEVISNALPGITQGPKFTGPTNGSPFNLVNTALTPASASNIVYGLLASDGTVPSGAINYSTPANYTLANSTTGTTSLFVWYRIKTDTTAENPTTTPTFTGTPGSGVLSGLVCFNGVAPLVGPITSTPSSVNFSDSTTTISVSDPNNTGTVTVTSNNTGLVTVSPSSFTGAGPTTITLTGVSPGTTTLTISDTNSNSISVPVTFSPVQGLVVKGVSANYSSTGTFQVSEYGFHGTFTASVADTSIATVTPASGSGPGPVTFTVNPISPGSTTLLVSDGTLTDTSVINVTGPLTVSSSSYLGNSTSSGTITVTEANYDGTITVSSASTAIATVSPASGSGPSFPFTVSAVALGNTTITVSDDHGGSQAISVSIQNTVSNNLTPTLNVSASGTTVNTPQLTISAAASEAITSKLNVQARQIDPLTPSLAVSIRTSANLAPSLNVQAQTNTHLPPSLAVRASAAPTSLQPFITIRAPQNNSLPANLTIQQTHVNSASAQINVIARAVQSLDPKAAIRATTTDPLNVLLSVKNRNLNALTAQLNIISAAGTTSLPAAIAVAVRKAGPSLPAQMYVGTRSNVGLLTSLNIEAGQQLTLQSSVSVLGNQVDNLLVYLSVAPPVNVIVAPAVSPNIQDRSAQAAQDSAVLDYQPNLAPEKIAAEPIATSVAASTAVAVPLTVSATQQHLVDLVATYHDVTAMSIWLQDAVTTLESALQEDTSAGITFSQYKTALQNPHDPASSSIIDTWNRFNWSYEGRSDAFLYVDIWHLATQYQPTIVTATENLLAISSFAILGATDTNLTTASRLDLIAASAGLTDTTISTEQLAAYQKLQDTLAAMNSSVAYVSSEIKAAIDQNIPIAQEAQELVLLLSTGIDTHQTGIGLNLGEVISVLQGLRLIFELLNDQSWLNISGLLTRLDQIVETLILDVIMEAAGMLGHLQSMIVAPIVSLLGKIDNFYSLMGKRQNAASLDKFGNTLATLCETVVEKFEGRLLEGYRHTQLHNSLVSSKVQQTATNDRYKNLIKTLDLMIGFLQGAQGVALEWASIANNVGLALNSSAGKYATLPSLPALAVQKPPISSSLEEIVQTRNVWGVVSTGTPSETARHLLNLVRAQKPLV